ncbi:MAG: 30S ribosomal protein S20 [Candidatus Levybacteria bacterium]|nr:30S ribosomal protein S20 [Candidatus Levybacteria bacterium]
MPVIKSAKKKLRKDKKRTVQNKKVRTLFTNLVKKAKKNPSEKTVQEAIKTTDKAAKKHIIHKNKASRIKSALSKLLSLGKKPHRTTKDKPQKPKKANKKE